MHDLATFTAIHTILSIVALLAGIPALALFAGLAVAAARAFRPGLVGA